MCDFCAVFGDFCPEGSDYQRVRSGKFVTPELVLLVLIVVLTIRFIVPTIRLGRTLLTQLVQRGGLVISWLVILSLHSGFWLFPLTFGV